MELTKGIIQDIASCAAAQVMEALGVTSGRITQRQAEETYGKWFRDAIRDHRIKPVSVGEGRNGRRMYSVKDILALRAEDAARASLETKLIMSSNN
jgi:hypothetical protein